MKNNYSILRDEEYRELSKLELAGRILDLGGNKKSGYHKLIKGEHEIITTNIDINAGHDIIFDMEKRFPLDSESYDHILCVNALEHIYNFSNVINEAFRVLKNNGSLVLATPFIF